MDFTTIKDQEGCTLTLMMNFVGSHIGFLINIDYGGNLSAIHNNVETYVIRKLVDDKS